MNIIVHCKQIEWDFSDCEYERSDTKKKLPRSYSFKISLSELQPDSCCGSGSSIEERITSVLDECISDILTDKFGFCINHVGSFTWEYDPESCLKIVKRDATKVLKAWKKEKAKLDAVVSDPKFTMASIASCQKSYEAWLKKNLTKRGYIGTICFNEPDDIIANLAK